MLMMLFCFSVASAMEKTQIPKGKSSFRVQPVQQLENSSEYVQNLSSILSGITKNYTDIIQSEKLSEKEVHEITEENAFLKVTLSISQGENHKMAEGVTSDSEGHLGYQFLKNLISSMSELGLSLERFSNEGKVDEALYNTHTSYLGKLVIEKKKVRLSKSLKVAGSPNKIVRKLSFLKKSEK